MQQFRLNTALRPATLARFGSFGFVLVMVLLVAAPAWAHHPFGGDTPNNAFQGFLSGLGHPVIGIDHLAFVIAAGLLAAAVGRGLVIPVSFVLASMGGTVLHLLGMNLPAPEFFIAGSVLVFGGLLAMKQQLPTGVIVGLGVLAGLFHGYAYGEAVIGAGMASIAAYLVGFALIQMVIAIAAYAVASRLVNRQENSLGLRFAGFALAGAGMALLSGVVLG